MAKYGKLGDGESVARGNLLLADLAMAEGAFDRAHELAAAALQYFDATADVDHRSAAHERLARLELGRGHVPLARAEVARALATAPAEPRFELRVRLALTEARLQAAEGHAHAAHKQLERWIATCARAGFGGLTLEAQLALLEVERGAGSPSAAAIRRRATALQQQARRRGFVVIADRAAQL